MGLFAKKKEPLTQEDKDLLLLILKEDKLRWEMTFPMPCFNINWAIESVTNGKELTSSDIETCENAIKRYLSNHKDNVLNKEVKALQKKL